MTLRETITEVIGSICFIGLLYGMMMALYVISPAQPSMHSEATYQEAGQ